MAIRPAALYKYKIEARTEAPNDMGSYRITYDCAIEIWLARHHEDYQQALEQVQAYGANTVAKQEPCHIHTPRIFKRLATICATCGVQI